MKAQAKSLGTVHVSLVQVIYANSEGPGERAHSCIIGYLKQQGDNSSRRQHRDWYVKGSTLCMLNNCTGLFSRFLLFYLKRTNLKKFVRDIITMNVKQFGSRSGATFCQA